MTPQQAAAELLRRRRARRSFPEFVQAIDLPGRPVSDADDEWLFHPVETGMAAHHLLFTRTLDALHRGEFHNCMIFAPPGSAKSSYGSVAFPAYVLGHQKMARVIMASYASDIARKQSRRTRQIVRSPKYRPIFDAGLTAGNEAVDAWALDNSSEYMAGGITAGVTGNRASCFVGETPVRTLYGDARIDTIAPDTLVLGYDHQRGVSVWARVRAVQRQRRGELVRVTTERGRAFVCTADHPIYAVGRGYVSAEVLGCGDALVVCNMPKLPGVEAGGVEGLLPLLQLGAHGDGEQALRLVRGAGDAIDRRVGEAGPQRGQSGVLQQVVPSQEVQQPTPQEAEAAAQRQKAVPSHAAGQDVPMLRGDLSRKERAEGDVLKGLRGQDAQRQDDRHGQQQVQGRQELRFVVPADAPADPRAGRGLRGLPDDDASGGASHRRTAGQQRPGQFGDSVPPAPHAASQGDTVALVERLCGREEWVYDLDVEGVHNFFAGEVLAHNCLIIDDPVSGREDADSAAMRKKTREAYEDDLSTRLMPGAKQLIIQTRWHAEDLSGGLLPKNWDGESGLLRGRDGQDWMVVCLPAVADRPDDPLGRKIGEPLWPEWFKGDHFERYRANARTWSSLFQQKPTPEDGDYFKREMFRFYTNPPKQLRVYGASDFAVTDGGGDHTVHGIFGVDPEGNIYALAWWRGQTAADIWIDELLTLADKWKVVKWFGEAGPIRRSIEPYLKKRMQERHKYVNMEWLASVSDKPTRARSIQGRIAQGMVYLPAGVAWATDVVSQALRFPNTDDDDDVDVLSLLGRGLDGMVNAEPPRAERKKAPEPGTMAWVLERSKEQKVVSKYR